MGRPQSRRRQRPRPPARSLSPTPCAPLRTAPSTASRTQAQGWPGACPGQLGRGWLGDWCSPKAESPMKALTLLVLEGRTRRFLLTLTHLRTFTTFSQWKGTGQGLGLRPPPACEHQAEALFGTDPGRLWCCLLSPELSCWACAQNGSI